MGMWMTSNRPSSTATPAPCESATTRQRHPPMAAWSGSRVQSQSRIHRPATGSKARWSPGRRCRISVGKIQVLVGRIWICQRVQRNVWRMLRRFFVHVYLSYVDTVIVYAFGFVLCLLFCSLQGRCLCLLTDTQHRAFIALCIMLFAFFQLISLLFCELEAVGGVWGIL